MIVRGLSKDHVFICRKEKLKLLDSLDQKFVGSGKDLTVKKPSPKHLFHWLRNSRLSSAMRFPKVKNNVMNECWEDTGGA